MHKPLPLTYADQFFFTTLRVKALKNKRLISRGTGFFYNFRIKDKGIPALITNRHVVKGSDTLEVVFHKAAGNRPSGEFLSRKITVSDGVVIEHPGDTVDLCAVLWGDIFNKAAEEGESIFYKGFSDPEVPKDEDWQLFDAIEQVIMVGCPHGIIDEVNNLPVARRGCRATRLVQSESPL